jgi:serine/threonine protein kinase
MRSSTKTDRWILIQEIFHNAFERPLAERNDYLKQACGDDEQLRSEVASLLASDGDGATVHSLIASDIKELEHNACLSEAGIQVGAYRLIRELDSGGMGVVYLAVRSDDQYFQIVAIKMIRKGMDSPALIQRFRAERQILATVTHPNIGAILDGGETEDGRPFIVMEYVEGQAITEASENRNLSIRQRVELFRSVCSAVHFAHQKQIIHRDIKPSNVLVTGQGIVKLIDFGVSKPLVPELIPGDLPKTGTYQVLMTPDYASPEQFLGRELTTASDIYSLGVLLFELLTGSRPYTVRDLSRSAAEKVICHQESPRPSSVRGISPRVRREIAGDLDRIVLMAMGPDPCRRYLSVQHLEEDLLRFLQGKPVLARKSTAIYRLSKFVRRNRMGSLMTCLTVAALTTSILFYVWQSRMSNRRVHQFEALTDSAISDLTEKLEQSPQSTEMQAALFHSALKYLEQVRQSSGNDPHLLLRLAKAYERVGDLEGAPSHANLGRVGTAVASYQESLRAAMAAQARMPGDECTQIVIEVYERLGVIDYYLGHIQEAHDNYQHALSFAQQFSRQKPEDRLRQGPLAMISARLGDLELDNLETDRALRSYEAALEIFGRDPNGNENHDKNLSNLHIKLAGALVERGRQSEALTHLRAAITYSEAIVQQAPTSKKANRNLLVSYSYMIAPLVGTEALNVGDSKQAQMYARKVLAIAEKLAAADPKNMRARCDLAISYSAMGEAFHVTRPDTAIAWYRKALSLLKEISGEFPSASYIQGWIPELDEELAAVLPSRQQASERLRLLEEANSSWKKLVAESPHKPQYQMSLMRSYCKLSDAELYRNDIAPARKYADSAMPFLAKFKPDAPSLLVLRDVGFCDESMGNLQRHIAAEQSLSLPERQAAEAASRQWYKESTAAWAEWDRRGAATPESQAERRKVERLLAY